MFPDKIFSLVIKLNFFTDENIAYSFNTFDKLFLIYIIIIIRVKKLKYLI